MFTETSSNVSHENSESNNEDEMWTYRKLPNFSMISVSDNTYFNQTQRTI